MPRGFVYSIEKDFYWIEKAKKRLDKFDNVVFVNSEFENFSKEKYFDVAVVHYVLHDALDKELFVDCLRKNLREGGYYICVSPLVKIMVSVHLKLKICFFLILKKMSFREERFFSLAGGCL